MLQTVGSVGVGEGVAVGVAGDGLPVHADKAVCGVVGGVSRSGIVVGLAQALAHRVKGVALRLAVPVVHALEPVQVVVALGLPAATDT